MSAKAPSRAASRQSAVIALHRSLQAVAPELAGELLSGVFVHTAVMALGQTLRRDAANATTPCSRARAAFCEMRASHKSAKAAEFTGRARWGISSTAPSPTARIAEGSFGDENFGTSVHIGRPPRPPRHAAIAAEIDSARRVGSSIRSTLQVAAGRGRFPRPLIPVGQPIRIANFWAARDTRRGKERAAPPKEARGSTAKRGKRGTRSQQLPGPPEAGDVILAER